jgi:hypothetical protein
MKETKFKAGDRVRIREDLSDRMPFGVNDDMIALQGKEVIITGAYDTYHSETTGRYTFDGDGGWCWSDQMFDLVQTDVTRLFKAGGMVVFRDKTGSSSSLHGIMPKVDGTLTFTTESGSGWIDASDYDEDGIHQGGTVSKNKDYDLMEIYAPAKESKYAGKFVTTGRELLWKRTEVKELTLQEVAKLAGCDVSQLKIKK